MEGVIGDFLLLKCGGALEGSLISSASLLQEVCSGSNYLAVTITLRSWNIFCFVVIAVAGVKITISLRSMYAIGIFHLIRYLLMPSRF